MGVEWMNVLFELRALNQTVESLGKVGKDKYFWFNQENNLFQTTRLSPSSAASINPALDATVKKVIDIESKIRELFPTSRRYGQSEFDKEMKLLDKNVKTCLDLGFYQIKGLYNDEKISRTWDRLKDFRESDDHKQDIGEIRTSRFPDFLTIASDLRGIKENSTEEEEIDCEAEEWTVLTKFYGKICADPQNPLPIDDADDGENADLYRAIAFKPLDLSAPDFDTCLNKQLT